MNTLKIVRKTFCTNYRKKLAEKYNAVIVKNLNYEENELSIKFWKECWRQIKNVLDNA